jgi:hypothetical protein
VNSTAAIVRAYQDIARRKEVGDETPLPQEPQGVVGHDGPTSLHNDWKAKLSHLLQQYACNLSLTVVS